MKTTSPPSKLALNLLLLLTAVFFKPTLYGQPSSLLFDNYTIENGLSNNLVHFAFQDKKGWMWFGTYQGLNRFDGSRFTIFENSPRDTSSIGHSIIRSIFEDDKGNLWVGTEHKGVYLFNRDRENFSALHAKNENFDLTEQTVNIIKQDRFGNFWIATNDGLCQINQNWKILKVFQHDSSNPNSIISNGIKTILIDRSGKIWLGTVDGLDILDPLTGKVSHLGVIIPTVANEICTLFCDVDSRIWVGSYKYGITIIDPLTLSTEHLTIDKSNERSNAVRAIVKDGDNYWIGTRGGLYIYSKSGNRFSYFKQDEREGESLIHNSILDIFKDSKGDFWISTRGGISYVVKEKQIFKCYKAFPNDNHYLNNSEVYAFWVDPMDRIWVGTETGGTNVLDRKRGTFTYLKSDGASKSNSASNNCIKAITGDNAGNVWIGTYLGGIEIVNLKTGQTSYSKHNPLNANSPSNDRIWALYCDSRNAMWVGSDGGLDKFDPKTKTYTHFTNIVNKAVIWIEEDSNHDLWIITHNELLIYNEATKQTRRFAERTRMMHEDSQGQFWVTTLDKGLVLFDKTKGIVKQFDQTKGIVNNQTYCVLEDNNGYLWISTINGLSRFDRKTETFKNYDKRDGLLNNQFRYGACCKTPQGELIFGGITGFNILNPTDIKENEYLSPIVLTDFRIFNKAVKIGDKSVLKKSISETKKIKLAYNQNSITIDFAALSYAKAAKNKYSYKLEGFDKEWSEPSSQHSVSYTNINPGTYSFMVKASNGDGYWSRESLSLSIVVTPPFWSTWWFKIIIIIALVITMYWLLMFMINRNHLKSELLYERQRAQKLHELDMMKVQFFTNVSHELRTPLTLIVSPLEKMINSEMTMPEVKSHLELMNRNARQLLQMVNQLLDFRKVESGNQKLELNRGDMVFFINEILSAFRPLATEKSIKLEFKSAQAELFALFDADKLEKITNNLVSNALKFTPGGGSVSLSLSLISEDVGETAGKYIELVVKDTGVGIPETNLQKIFNRFFQSENTNNVGGTGIGLALTKELVKLHNGRVYVESEIGKGSAFTVLLPYSDSIEKEVNTDISVLNIGLHTKDEELINNKILLVVDDTPDVRFFIRSHFSPEYTVIEAANGKEGLSLAFKYLPDIIISDIMMPVLDGTEFCKRLKKDERTSHIPIILLTALSSQSKKLEGALVGADDYLTKPFDMLFLKTKVDNLLMIRNMLREKYSGEFVLKPKNIVLENPDERFLQKVIDTIEKNITDADFEIDKLAVEVGVSRTQMYRKMSVLTDMTVREFIKSIRLKRAAQLLTQNKMNVSDVAYAVGFKDLSHFRKCFRQQFGVSATEYTKQTDSNE